MKCSNCGAPVQSDFKLCPYCGMDLGEFVDADDVFEKMEDMDDKLDNIKDSLHNNPLDRQHNSTNYNPIKETGTDKVAKIAFFIVFFVVLLVILAGALSMCGRMGMGMYF